MRKRSTIPALAVLAACALSSIGAAGRTTVTVQSTDGTPDQTFDLTEKTRIGFSMDNSALAITGTDSGTASFSLKNIRVIKFSTDLSGIDNVTEEDVPSISLLNNPVGDVMRFAGANGTQYRASIYSLQGACLQRIEAWQGEDIDVSTLSPGLYIFQFDNNSIKFIKK